MNLTTTIEFDSRVAPGVRFTIAKPTAYRRAKVAVTLRETGTRIQKLLKHAMALAGKGHLCGSESEQLIQLGEIIHAETTFRLQAEYLRAFLASIDGLSLNGTEPDKETFIRDAPSELFNEVAEIVQTMLGQPEQRVLLPAPKPSSILVEQPQ